MKKRALLKRLFFTPFAFLAGCVTTKPEPALPGGAELFPGPDDEVMRNQIPLDRWGPDGWEVEAFRTRQGCVDELKCLREEMAYDPQQQMKSYGRYQGVSLAIARLEAQLTEESGLYMVDGDVVVNENYKPDPRLE